MTTEYSWAWPLRDDQSELTFQTTTDIVELTRFNIKNTLFACPGERFSVPDFGVCLRSLTLFEFPTEETLLNVHSKITEGINRWIPYVYIQNLQVKTTPEQPEIIQITLKYIIGDVNIEDVLSFDIPTTP